MFKELLVIMNNAPLCSLCVSDSLTVFDESDAKSQHALEICACKRCGFVQQLNCPNDEELRIYYAHHYREDYKKVYRPELKHVYRAGTAACDRLGFLIEHASDFGSKNLLDVGAGGGEFVYIASKQGFDARGVEPNLGYSEFARVQYNVDVTTGMIQDLDPGSTDIITLFHVLEHIAKPKAVMAHFWKVLRPGGLLFIEVPNILQADASPSNIFFKAHLHYFSRFTLQSTASMYFEPLMTEDRGNLKMIFKRRDVPLNDINLPTSTEVEYTFKRLKAKGWCEYLTVGGGWIKPFRKLVRIAQESRLSGNPRDILDTIYMSSVH